MRDFDHGYTKAERRRALDMMLRKMDELDDCDCPHGRCPHCGSPVEYDEGSFEDVEYAGAIVALEYRGSYGCGECGIEIDESEVVR